MIGVKQGGIKYHFLSLWYDSTWNGNLVSRIIGKYSTYLTISQFIGGACGVMAIIEGYGHGDTSSNPGPDWLYFT